MKKLTIIKLIFILFCTSASGQVNLNDHDGEIMQIKGTWTKGKPITGLNDPHFLRTQYPMAYARTDAIASMIKNIFLQPVGLEAIHYASIGGWPVYNGSPAAYSFLSYYKSYYYNRHVNKILLAGETQTTVRIHINHFGLYLLTGDTLTLMIDGRPTKVFAPLKPDGEWKGLPLYKNETWKPGNREKSITKIVLLTRNGQHPLLAVTQKQYLEGLKILWQNQKQETSDRYMNAEKEMLKIMEEAKNNKYFDAVTKEKLLTVLQKDFDRYMQTRDAEIKKLTDPYDKKIKVAENYLSAHSDKELQQPAVTASFGDFSGYFGDDGKQRAVTVVRVDPLYFKPHLSRDVPQFMVMEWNAEPDAPGMNFRKIFEETFPVEKLKAMIDHNRVLPQKPLLVKKTEGANDPELKAVRIKAGRYADSMMAVTKTVFPFSYVTTVDTSHFTFPVRNDKWLAAIPKKKLPATELKNYLGEIDKKFTALLLGFGIKLPQISHLNAGEISYASSFLLTKGMSDQAAWLALKAVQQAPGNVLVLNNSGAVLNACGFQPVAIPVLETALEKSPDNSAIQNNLGQAYAALGELTKAVQHLQQSVSSNPYHPHANLSLALIHHSKGNSSSAIKYVENSLHGAFTTPAWHLLLKLKPDARLINYLKHRYKPPDYFNEDKYHLPRQCENVSDIGLLKGEYAAFRQMVEKVKKQFDAIRKEEYESGMHSLSQKIKNYQTSGIQQTSFTALGNAMLFDLKMRLEDEREKLARAQHIYHKSIAELQKAYKDAYTKAKECEEQLGLSNRYMQLMAFVTREYQKQWMHFWKDYFNDFAFWSRFAHPDAHLQRADYASTVSGYLGEMLRVAETQFLETAIDCNDGDEIKNQGEELKIYPPDCAVDIGLEFGIGSFSIDCEKMEYHFGGLLVADVVHSYRNHRTTIAIGAGLDLKFGGEKLKAGPIQGGFNAKGKMQYFLTFDGTHPSDQGLIWEAAIKYKQKLKTGMEGIEKLEEIETTSVNLSANSMLSVHNGWSFDGSFYDYLDTVLGVKPEEQKNKNIKIFQK